MLADNQAYATLPTSDMGLLRTFYEQTLGFTAIEETPAGIYFRAGECTIFAITVSSGTPSGSHTQLGFRVADIDAEVADLRRRGVKLEDYETPRTIGGIATLPLGRAAWFKDPAGNLIGVIEFNDPG